MENKCAGCKWEEKARIYPCSDCVRETNLVDKYEKKEEKTKLPETIPIVPVNSISEAYNNFYTKINKIIDYLKEREIEGAL